MLINWKVAMSDISGNTSGDLRTVAAGEHVHNPDMTKSPMITSDPNIMLYAAWLVNNAYLGASTMTQYREVGARMIAAKYDISRPDEAAAAMLYCEDTVWQASLDELAYKLPEQAAVEKVIAHVTNSRRPGSAQVALDKRREAYAN